jgi:hypothetical protein
VLGDLKVIAEPAQTKTRTEAQTMDKASIAVGAVLLLFSVVEVAFVIRTNASRWMVMQACGFSQLAMVILVPAILGKGAIQLGLMIAFGLSASWFFVLQVKQIRQGP